MRLKFRAGVFVAIALLAACAGNPLATVPPNAVGFELAGRMSVRSRDRAFSSALRWKQNTAADEIWLNTPLGQTLAHLEDGGGGATLTTAEQKQYHAQSIESLTQSVFGWRFPLAGLRYWVLGQTAPGVTHADLQRDQAHRITQFMQADWRVAFEYAEAGAVRPSRVDVAAGDVQIRLVIDHLELRPL
jgi:outer membrane lipoprotein LolB